MIPDAATTSPPAPQAATPGPQASAPAGSTSAAGAAPGPQPAPVSPAAQPTPVQLFWEVARLAFVLMTRLIQVLQPIQSYYLNQSRQIMRVCTELCRVMLTIRFAPERVTIAQLRHLTRARHILQALFGYTLPLGARTPSSANATFNQSPSASAENATPLGPRTSPSATTHSPTVAAVPGVSEVPEVPEVPGVASPSTPAAVSSPTSAPSHLPPDPSHSSHDSHSSQSPHSKGEDPVGLRDPIPHSVAPHSAFRIQHSAFSPYIPDANTLIAAVRAATLPPNCAGALLENPGEALVRALHELHAVYFSLYPNQPPTPSPAQSPSPSPSQPSGNLQSGTPQSDDPSVHSASPVNTVHSVQSVQSVKPDSSQSEIPHSTFHIPHSTAPP